jgi:PTH1 family peptidyl-tRNA hydrolase
LGIGHPGNKERVHGHVLGNFTKEDDAWREPLLKAVAENAALLITPHKNHELFMTKVAAAMPKITINEKEQKNEL